jgi:hypothetical protein
LNRKLLILDVALAGALAWGGFRLRDQWQAEKGRETAALGHAIKPAAPPPFTPAPASPAVLASSYARIAQQMLLDKSRNPVVVIEVPPPPPPKPMPPLPLYHGTMNLGEGPLAVLSLPGTKAQKEIHVGDQIGEFKLVDITTEEIALEWDGKVVRKKVDEVLDRSAAEAPQQRTDQQPAAAVGPPPPPRPAQTPQGPGSDSGRGYRTCQVNDSNPSGAVVDGYRKTVTTSPFGPVCRWDAVQ